MLYNCTYCSISVWQYCSNWCAHSNITCLMFSCYLHKHSVMQRYETLGVDGPLPHGRTSMGMFEFHRPPLDVRRRKYRELCFLRGTILACNMISFIYMFCMYLGINRDSFPIQHQMTQFKTLSGVFTARYGLSLYYISALFTCFVCISEEKTITFLCSINWSIFKTETESVYCAVRP
jgi:hypothetical protein